MKAQMGGETLIYAYVLNASYISWYAVDANITLLLARTIKLSHDPRKYKKRFFKSRVFSVL